MRSEMLTQNLDKNAPPNETPAQRMKRRKEEKAKLEEQKMR